MDKILTYDKWLMLPKNMPKVGTGKHFPNEYGNYCYERGRIQGIEQALELAAEKADVYDTLAKEVLSKSSITSLKDELINKTPKQ